MDISPVSLVLIALVLAAWAVGAAVVIIRANRGMKRARALKTSLKRMQALLDVAPALPLLVRVDGRIEAPDKLARLLGLAAMPKYLSELAPDGGASKAGGLSREQVDQLWARVQATQKSAAP
ncbi:MAG: histidine kinase, partial [Alphaproteobacteria bacterium]|nr:histidine kinase [Alphaproteobacteria bacterium]